MGLIDSLIESETFLNIHNLM